MLGVVIFCVTLVLVRANDDGSTLREARPPYDITKHMNWNLMDHESCGQSIMDRIIGGTNASLGQYPWIARVGYSDVKNSKVQFRCGGSLISPFYVITAAHCVSNLPPELIVSTIRLGEFNAETNPDCDPVKNMCAAPVQDFIPQKVIVHKEYGNPKYKNDIALIRLNREVDVNGWVTPICMPSGDILNRNYAGQLAEVAGWGIFDIDDPKTSIILQTIKMPIVPLTQCVTSFQRHASINGKQMCVGGKLGQDSCGGDSGGPLMKVDVVDQPRYYFIGLVSFGAKQCGSSTNPAVYTRIAAYLDWILDNMTA